MRRTDSASRRVSRAPIRSPFLDEIEGHQHAAAVAVVHLHARKGLMAVNRIPHQPAERPLGGEDGFHAFAQHLAPGAADKLLGGGADQHHLPVTGEQHQAVLQVGHDLIEVLLQGGENLLNIAKLAAEPVDLGGHHSILVRALRLRFGRQLQLPGGHAVQPLANHLQGLQRQV